MRADFNNSADEKIPAIQEREISSFVHEFNNLISILYIQTQEMNHKNSDNLEVTAMLQNVQRTIERMKNANQRLYRLVDQNEKNDSELSFEDDLMQPRGTRAKLKEGTVLLVEDEQEFSRILKKKLEREGFSVISARRFREARDVIDSNSHTLTTIISDEHLPDGHGSDLLAYAQAKNQDLQLVLTSGKPLNPATPNVASLRKPFSFEDLIQAIKF